MTHTKTLWQNTGLGDAHRCSVRASGIKSQRQRKKDRQTETQRERQTDKQRHKERERGGGGAETERTKRQILIFKHLPKLNLYI